MRPIVFVAGKLRDAKASQVAANVLTAQEAVILLVQLGCAPYSPHQNIGFALGRMDELHAESVNRAFLSLAEAVYVLPGWASSLGTIQELKYAERAGKPILHDPQGVQSWLMTRTHQ